MDEILIKASNQAVSFAIKSGISIASGFAIKTITKLLDQLPENVESITNTRSKIATKILVISSATELIRLVAVQGTTSLGPTIALIDDLEDLFTKFDKDMEALIDKVAKANNKDIIAKVNQLMADLVDQIDMAVPLINLSLITSGVNVQNLNKSISYNKLIKVSDYIKHETAVVGPTFTMTYYSVFYNPTRLKSDLDCITWKEEFAKAQVQVKKNNGYKIEMVEDLDDGRYHEEDPRVKTIDVNDVGKLFFTGSGKLLKLDSSLPVLILKIGDEYLGLGNYQGSNDGSDSDSDTDSETGSGSSQNLGPKSESVTDLSILEYLIRLLKLKSFENKPLDEISDEKFKIFLNNANLGKFDDTLNSNITRLNNLQI